MYQAKVYCIITVVLVSVLFFATKKERNRANIIYSILLVDSLLQLIFDLATVYTVNNMDTVPEYVNQTAHRLSFITLLIVGYITFEYLLSLIESELKRPLYSKKTEILLTMPVVITLVLVSVLPIYYRYEKTTNYSFGPAVHILYLSLLVYVILILYVMIAYRTVISRQKKTAVYLAFITEVLVTVYQLIFPTSLVSSFGVTILVLGFYVTTENPDAIMVEKLKDLSAKADAANKAKTNFLANMSHEIRTPINTVIGMNEMILRDSQEPDICEYAADVKCAAKSLLSIINDILDITKIEEGKLDILPVKYHFSSLIYDVYTTIDFKAKEKGLDFQILTIGPLPSVLIGDDIRLKQILINLLNNAVKYTHQGSVTLTIKQLSEDSTFFSVKDTGIGIKEEDINRLFIPFERIEEERNRSIEGTGIGLNITTQLLKLLGSELQVKSVYGEGSDFFFTLKQKVVDPTPVDVKNLCKPADTESEHFWIYFEAPEAKILVVDDNDLNRKVFKNLLKETKIQITEASSGMECLELTKKERFDIIFMDHLMPHMDGVQTLHAMRAQEDNLCKDTTVVALTANALTGAKKYYFDKGFDEFLSKPIDPQRLEETLFSLLDYKLIHKRNNVDKDKEAAAKAKLPRAGKGENKIDTASLPIINGIDWNYAKLHFNDYDSLLEAMQIYLGSIKKDADELQKCFDNIDTDGGMEDYQIKVHSMKNSAALIGNVQMAGMAMALESAARNKDGGSIKAMHSIFIQKWVEYAELLDVFAAEKVAKKNAADCADELKAIFDKIRSAAAELDDETLDEMSKRLDEYEFDDDMAKKIEEVKSQILNFEIEKLMNCSCYSA